MGRQSIPDHVKEAQGTLKKYRVNENPATAEKLIAIPDVPDDVTGDGPGYFTWACEILLSLGLLTAAYIPDISRAAMAHNHFIKAEREISKKGATQKYKTGHTQIKAIWTVWKDSQKVINDFESKYGLNLVSAQKISVPDKPTNDGDFD